MHLTYTEVACPEKKLSLKNSQNSKKNTCVGVSYLSL